MFYETKEDIVAALHELIYEGDGYYTIQDVEDIVGDGDLVDYI